MSGVPVKVFRIHSLENDFIFLLLFQVRHNIRPYFLVSDSYKNVYDVVTWASTQIAISYTVAPFVLLAVGPSLKFYRYVCFTVS